jgi:hypothetical protein
MLVLLIIGIYNLKKAAVPSSDLAVMLHENREDAAVSLCAISGEVDTDLIIP